MFEFLEAGGPFMWLLLTMSVVALTYIIERGLALRWRNVVPEQVATTLSQCENENDLATLQTVCRQLPSPASRMLLAAMDQFAYSKAENIEALQTRARKEISTLESGLVVIEVIVGSAPLLGLVGTLHGLITLFGDFGAASMADHTSLAKGISIALNTTLTGLLIAIPSLIAWSYYNKKVETMAIELEALCDDLLQRYYPPSAHASQPLAYASGQQGTLEEPESFAEPSATGKKARRKRDGR
jgi:biopolymer transport protein ExbB